MTSLNADFGLTRQNYLLRRGYRSNKIKTTHKLFLLYEIDQKK